MFNVFEFQSTISGLGRLDLIPVLLTLLFLLFTSHFRFLYKTSSAEACSSDPRAFQTLSAFVTPTSCASLSDTNSFLKNTKILESYLIELDLSDLIDSICTGKAELRDSSDLHELFREKLRIYGWRFGLFVDKKWSFRILRWMVIHHVYIFLRSITIPLQPRTQLHSTTSIDLDFVPFHKLEKVINKIQSSLQPDSTIILEFSCLAPGVRFMDHDFILCAIPFLLPTSKDSKEALRYSRTTTPLLTRFKTFVALMSSESSTIRSIENISRSHASSLLQLEERLSNDRHLRMACVRKEGIAGWREKKFMSAWEAGLLRAGFLTRWRVTLVK